MLPKRQKVGAHTLQEEDRQGQIKTRSWAETERKRSLNLPRFLRLRLSEYRAYSSSEVEEGRKSSCEIHKTPLILGNFICQHEMRVWIRFSLAHHC